MSIRTSDPLRLPTARGIRVDPGVHPDACTLQDLPSYLRTRSAGPLAVDLFCGAGGLSLGLEAAGFDVVLGVDRDAGSVATHRAYFGGASVVGDLSSAEFIQEIVGALQGVPVALVAGGPPCQPFSRAGRSKIRSLLQNGLWDADDRRELWQAFVDVVAGVKPRAVLVENVPDMALGHDAHVLRQLVAALERAGYDVYSRILASWQYGVPQYRQRLILVGLQRGVAFEWPRPLVRRQDHPRVSLRTAIEDLQFLVGDRGQLIGPYPDLPPRVRLTAYQRWCRDWQPAGRLLEDPELLYQHFTRAVREDDLIAFRELKEGGTYADLPDEKDGVRLRRYATDKFDDRYNRLWWDRPSRTITAHLAKDGYWYIHPHEPRTLSVREAARLQGFPDRFRFAGTPTHAYRQIGQAVPPMLGLVVGRAIRKSLERGEPVERPTTEELAATLQAWVSTTPEREMAAPWRRSDNLWLVLLGMTGFERLRPEERRDLWGLAREQWGTPQQFLENPDTRTLVRTILHNTRSRELIEQLAADFHAHGNADPETLRPTGISPDRLALAHAVCGIGHRLPVTAPALRVAERIFGEHVQESRMLAQLLLARLVGVDDHGRAFAGILEIGDRFCGPGEPRCGPCPVRDLCAYARGIPPVPSLFDVADDPVELQS